MSAAAARTRCCGMKGLRTSLFPCQRRQWRAGRTDRPGSPSADGNLMSASRPHQRCCDTSSNGQFIDAYVAAAAEASFWPGRPACTQDDNLYVTGQDQSIVYRAVPCGFLRRRHPKTTTFSTDARERKPRPARSADRVVQCPGSYNLEAKLRHRLRGRPQRAGDEPLPFRRCAGGEYWRPKSPAEASPSW